MQCISLTYCNEYHVWKCLNHQSITTNTWLHQSIKIILFHVALAINIVLAINSDHCHFINQTPFFSLCPSFTSKLFKQLGAINDVTRINCNQSHFINQLQSLKYSNNQAQSLLCHSSIRNNIISSINHYHYYFNNQHYLIYPINLLSFEQSITLTITVWHQSNVMNIISII